MKFKDKITIKDQLHVGERLDKFLVDWVKDRAKEGDGFSRGDLTRFIKEGKVKVNDGRVKQGYSLKFGDVVGLNFEKKEKGIIASRNFEIEIIFEDSNIIVVNKHAGISVHPSSERDEGTLANALVDLYPEIVGIGDGSLGSHLRPGIVHRLDKDTSGVMVVARNQKTFDELKRKFQNREVSKKYEAIIFGQLDKKRVVVTDPIARSSSYRKQVIAGKKTKTKVRDAVTEFEVIDEIGRYSVVEARPKTGRTHQIRVHLNSLGHPIVGDKLYTRKEFLNDKKLKNAKRQLLHAKELEFELFGEPYKFSAQHPFDFVEFLEEIRK
jgi:23S rRNA pseudouridine1911/1915/1917 synthase